MSEEQTESLQEVALLEVDRILRHVEQLRHQLRVIDEYVLAMKPSGLPRVRVQNAHIQSIGVNVEQKRGEIIVTVLHRGSGESQQEIQPQHDSEWELGPPIP